MKKLLTSIAAGSIILSTAFIIPTASAKGYNNSYTNQKISHNGNGYRNHNGNGYRNHNDNCYRNNNGNVNNR